MRKNQVNIGDVFGVKVSGRVVPVKIISDSPYGGWNGLNQKTKRAVRIRTAGRLRFKVDPNVKYQVMYRATQLHNWRAIANATNRPDAINAALRLKSERENGFWAIRKCK